MSKKTPLHNRHMQSKARMSDFGGYEMPLWFSTGARKEHLAVLTGAGLFDTSHMAVLMISGAEAFEVLQHCLTKDLARCIGKNKSPLVPGRATYGAFLDERGHVLDDAIVKRMDDRTFMVVVNAGMGGMIADHLAREARSRSLTVHIDDLTDQVGKIDLQGRTSAVILASILKEPAVLQNPMPFFSFRGHFDPRRQPSGSVRLANDVPILLSRTGYTGEFGFELFLPPDCLGDAWDLLETAGHPFQSIPCGLAARDSLRAGALLPLSHQDMGDWPFINNPWEHALPFNEDKTGFTKSFAGAEAVLEARGTGFFTYPYAGFDLRKITTGPDSTVVDSDGRDIGLVLTCVTDVAIDRVGSRIVSIGGQHRPHGFKPRGLCCGFIRTTSPLKTGTVVEIRDERRSLPVTTMDDLRPDRSARIPLRDMLNIQEDYSGSAGRHSIQE